MINARTASRDELVVEIGRLRGILNNVIKQRTSLTDELEQARRLLGQAEAGMELVDLIRRIVQ